MLWNKETGIYDDGEKYFSLTKKESIVFDLLYENKEKLVSYKQWDKLFRENEFYVYDVQHTVSWYSSQLNKKMKGAFTIITKRNFGNCLLEG